MYPNEAQEELGIHKTGDFTIQVKVRPCLLGVTHPMWQLGACLMFLTPWKMQNTVRAVSIQGDQMLLYPVVTCCEIASANPGKSRLPAAYAMMLTHIKLVLIESVQALFARVWAGEEARLPQGAAADVL